MKRFVSTLVASLFSIVLVTTAPVGAAHLEPTDCSALGEYEWARFQIDGALFPGYQTSISVGSSAYHEPFRIHGFGITQTAFAYYQPPTMRIPANISPGTHYVWVEQCGRKVAEWYAHVNQLQPWAIASKWYLSAGDELEWTARNFLPGERVDLFANGKYTGTSTTVLTTFEPKHGVIYQGAIAFGILKYRVPASMRSQTVNFELRGATSGTTASTRVSVAS